MSTFYCNIKLPRHRRTYNNVTLQVRGQIRLRFYGRSVAAETEDAQRRRGRVEGQREEENHLFGWRHQQHEATQDVTVSKQRISNRSRNEQFCETISNESTSRVVLFCEVARERYK